MNVSNVNQLFNQKIQDINSRLPSQTNITNKFQQILEQTQQKDTSTADQNKESTSAISTENNNTDVTSLLKTMLATQSQLNSISFSGDSSSSNLFPTSTFNNSINMIQQTQLLNALSKNSSSEN